jgi:hypothetical protein
MDISDLNKPATISKDENPTQRKQDRIEEQFE